MAAEPNALPGLRVVDENGALLGDMGDIVQRLQDELAGSERDVRKWRVMCANLERDADAEAEEDPLWPKAKEVFDHWRKQCRHPKAVWERQRFEEMRPYVKQFGVDMCKRAVDGIAFDPFITERKNGTQRRHDGTHLIFGSAAKFEERCNAAPRPKPDDDAPSPLTIV